MDMDDDSYDSIQENATNSNTQNQNLTTTTVVRRTTTTTNLYDPQGPKYQGPLIDQETGRRTILNKEQHRTDVIQRLGMPTYNEIIKFLAETKYLKLDGNYDSLTFFLVFQSIIDTGCSLSDAEPQFSVPYSSLRRNFYRMMDALEEFVQFYTEIPEVFAKVDKKLFPMPPSISDDNVKRAAFIADNTHYAIYGLFLFFFIQYNKNQQLKST